MAAIPRGVAEKIITGGHASSGAFHVANGVAMSYELEIGRYLEATFLLEGPREFVVVRDTKRSATTSRHIAALKALPGRLVVLLSDSEYNAMLRLTPNDRPRYALCKQMNIPFAPSESLGELLNAIADQLNSAIAAAERGDVAAAVRESTPFMLISWQRGAARIIMQAAQAVGNTPAWPRDDEPRDGQVKGGSR